MVDTKLRNQTDGQVIDWHPRQDFQEFTKEEIALKELRARIQDVILEDDKFDDDLYLLQWLKAQKLNVTKAQNMLRTAIKWRKDHRYDNLVNEDFDPDIAAELKLNYDGITKDGIPVLSIRAGITDFRRVMETRGREAYLRYWTQVFIKMENMMMESNRRRNEALRRQVGKLKITSNSTTGLVGVVDFQNFSLRQSTSVQAVQCHMEMLKILSNYFPAIFGHAYFFNANKFFWLAFKALRVFLEGPCLKLEIFDTNESLWTAAIYQRIDPEKLRPEFGGTMKESEKNI